MTPEMESLKARLNATWMAGDYGHFAKFLEPSTLEFLARLPIEAGTRLLNVVCGAGQIAIPAACTGARVTGVDIATNSIEQARGRAQAEGFNVWFDEGDAEMLSYEDASFDLVVSLFGAMFAPRAMRVCEPCLRPWPAAQKTRPSPQTGTMYISAGYGLRRLTRSQSSRPLRRSWSSRSGTYTGYNWQRWRTSSARTNAYTTGRGVLAGNPGSCRPRENHSFV